MAIFLKNFMGMTDEEIRNTWIKCGDVEMSTRVFQDIMGRERSCPSEDKILLNVLTDLTSGEEELEFPFNILLRLEYGKDVIPLDQLPEEVLNYLFNTPYGVIRLDHTQAILSAQRLFDRQLTA